MHVDIEGWDVDGISEDVTVDTWEVSGKFICDVLPFVQSAVRDLRAEGKLRDKVRAALVSPNLDELGELVPLSPDASVVGVQAAQRTNEEY